MVTRVAVRVTLAVALRILRGQGEHPDDRVQATSARVLRQLPRNRVGEYRLGDGRQQDG